MSILFGSQSGRQASANALPIRRQSTASRKPDSEAVTTASTGARSSASVQPGLAPCASAQSNSFWRAAPVAITASMSFGAVSAPTSREAFRHTAVTTSNSRGSPSPASKTPVFNQGRAR